RAVEWNLVDAVVPRSRFDEVVTERAQALAQQAAAVPRGPAVELTPIGPTLDGDRWRYRYVEVAIARGQRTATLTMTAPSAAPPETADAMVAEGAELWALRAFRELDDALLRLRFNEPEIGTILLRTAGRPEHVLAADRAVATCRDQSGFVREVALLQAR